MVEYGFELGMAGHYVIYENHDDYIVKITPQNLIKRLAEVDKESD